MTKKEAIELLDKYADYKTSTCSGEFTFPSGDAIIYTEKDYGSVNDQTYGSVVKSQKDYTFKELLRIAYEM